MRQKGRLCSVASSLLPFLVAIAPLLVAQSPNDTISNRRNLLVEVVRDVNTAEAKYRGKTGRFGEIDDLRKAHLLDMSVVVSKYPFAYGNSEKTVDLMRLVPSAAAFQLIVSSGGHHYNIAIKDSADPSNFGAFSDETGVIYTGVPLK
jgi:hypothetical protein